MSPNSIYTSCLHADDVSAAATAAGLALLASKLSTEAPPGCMLLSYMFKVPNWEHHLQATLPVTSGQPGRPDVSDVSKLYVYRKP
jgi:hypothetical protein